MENPVSRNLKSARRRGLLRRVVAVCGASVCSEVAAWVEPERNPFELYLISADDEGALDAELNRADAVIVLDAVLSPERLRQADNCLILARAGAGSGGLDLNLARRLGILVASVPSAVTSIYADLFLTVLDRLISAAASAGRPVRRLGLVGLGQVGRSVGRLGTSRGLQVWAHDPFAHDETFRQVPARRAPLPDLMGICDVVSVQVPLVPATRGLIAVPELDLLRRGAALICLSDPGLIDAQALAGRVTADPDFAAWLLEPEKPITDSAGSERLNELAGQGRIRWISRAPLHSPEAHRLRLLAALDLLADYENGLPLPHLLIDPALPRTDRSPLAASS